MKNSTRLILSVILLIVAVLVPGRSNSIMAAQGHNCGEWNDDDYGILHAFDSPIHPGVCYQCSPYACHTSYVPSYCNGSHSNC
jgi:hypothetical protein